ncbi:MAG: hypothetical protein Q8S33_06000 [Myxococcales bacterium]|nr:hypothetical protein [Myxococcales bacterium]MDP3499863.1 hypothetical protein [Myxococcales bacterium]
MENIPGPNATWAEIETFAVTFNGYARIGPRLGDLAAHHLRNGTIPSTLEELRGCLFFEQRRWRHQMSRPDDRGLAHIRALLEGIRAAKDEAHNHSGEAAKSSLDDV